MTSLIWCLIAVYFSFVVCVYVQRRVDRYRMPTFEAVAAARGFSAQSIDDLEELRRQLPFLTRFTGSIEECWIADNRKAELILLSIQSPDSAKLGYTLLVRRMASWSARVFVRGRQTPEVPEMGRDPDPRLTQQYVRQPLLVETLTTSSAWLLVEGPWRVVGTSPGRTAESLSRLVTLEEKLTDLIPESDDFEGGLEWNV